MIDHRFHGPGAGRRLLAAILALSFLAMAWVPMSGSWAAEKALPKNRQQLELSFAPLVKKVAPAVVNIYSKTVVEQRVSPLFDDPFFRRFFGDEIPFGRPQERTTTSLGSGVIVDPAGLIVTNHHVIKGAQEITVVLADRNEMEAELVQSDEQTDLAVLRVQAGGKRLPALALRDSDELEVGDLVLAIGNPFGVGQTVTSGIVSALARTQVNVADFRSFIQTDAAINPGNSGGALVSMDGRLVGINTAIFSRSGGSIGIGFAIPSNMVSAVLAAARGGKLVRPWLGASGQDVTSEIAASLDLERPRGVLLNEIHPGGPAARAGLRVGDIVVGINGRDINDGQELRFRLATLKVGGTAKLEILRDGRPSERAVPLEAPPEDPPRNLKRINGRTPLSGAVVANLSPALAAEIGLESTKRGVVIVEIERGSAADRFRLRPGDIVAEVNGTAVTSVSQLDGLLAAGGDAWRLTMQRGGQLFKLTVRS